MCGIAGFYNYNDEVVLRKMTEALVHRGPDDFGYAVFSNVSLGHRRLSIIDLSPRGHQPMHDDSGKVWIAYNGEVYNFQEKRQLLEKKGYKFFSRTDTEVILYLYMEFGLDCVKHLKGMFAFAIWDERNQRLFLARDHFGIKPLYYWSNGSSFFFASEIKSLLKVPEYSGGINFDVLPQYLSMQYVPSPDTMLEGIVKLQPAHYLIVEDGQIRICRYWDVKVAAENQKAVVSFRETAERLKQYLEDSVSSQMISDVPLGAFLSGGVDSSVVVAMMAKSSARPVKTFSVGFDVGQGYDERHYSDLVSNELNCEHYSIVLRPKIADLIPKIVYHMDEPIADPAIIPTYILSEFARKEVTVVLTGEGADELLGGYKQYRLDRLHGVYSLLPEKLRDVLHNLVVRRWKNPRVKTALDALALDDVFHRWLSWASIAEDSVVNEVLEVDVPMLRNQYLKSLKEDAEIMGSNLDEWLRFDMKYWLVDDLLMKVDKTSMAFSLEARVPYLDYQLVEFCFGLPARFKTSLFDSKRILRSVALDFLPPAICKRPKHGFNLPLGEWFKTDLSDLVEGTISDLRRSPFFKSRVLERIYTEHKKGYKDHSRFLFALIIFSSWYRCFLDKRI